MVDSLEALKEGLTLCRSSEARYALYPFLVLIVLIGCWFEIKAEALRSKKAASVRDPSAGCPAAAHFVYVGGGHE